MHPVAGGLIEFEGGRDTHGLHETVIELLVMVGQGLPAHFKDAKRHDRIVDIATDLAAALFGESDFDFH